MTTGKLIIGVTVGILLAAVILFAAAQAMKPRDCGLQQLQYQNGDRLLTDVDDACR